MTALRGSIKGTFLRLGARTPTPGAPVHVPYLPRGAPHAASTRSPTARANPCPPCNAPGLPRTVLAGSTISTHLTPTSSRVAGAVLSGRSIFCLSTRCASAAGPNPAPLASPSPRADPHGCGSLEPEPAAAPALFAAARAALTRFCSRVRAGSILGKTRTEEAAPHRLRRPEDLPAARVRLPPHHTHSLPLSHHSPPISIHLHPQNSIPHLPSSLSSSHPPNPRRNRARCRIWALSWFCSFFVFSIK